MAKQNDQADQTISPLKPAEIAIPVADPSDPYTIPATMPSSADKNPRSFKSADFAVPTQKIDDWRFTPVDRVSEFFNVFTPSNSSDVALSMIDGSEVPSSVTLRETTTADPAVGVVSAPTDRTSAVQWESTQRAFVLSIDGEIATPVVLTVSGNGLNLDALHIVVTAAERSHANVVIEHRGQARLAEGVEIITGKDSHISVASIQEWTDDSKHIAAHRIRVGEQATLRHSVVTLGGEVVRIRMDQDFGGPEGDLNMLGIYFVDPGQHIEHRTMVIHNYPECKSRVIYKGALQGKNAHSTWVGNALIEPTAPGTDSYELNRNLVLVPGAVADSEPNLEIENGNIVGAGHASSVGRFDDEELFYLQSRGIPQNEARKLVVRGFFGELIEEIGIPSISEHLMNVVDRRLSCGEQTQVED